MHIFVGVAIYAMPRDFHELSFLAEHQGIGRTGFHACRLLSLLQALVAHGALHDSRIPTGILEFRDIEGAGDHAKPAAHAFIAVPGDRPFFGLEHRIHQAGGRASGLPAVQALLLDEDRTFRRIEAIYDRVLLVAGIADLFERIVVLGVRNEIILRCRTGDFAGPASDTPRRVNKYSDELLGCARVGRLYVDVGYAPSTNGGRG